MAVRCAFVDTAYVHGNPIVDGTKVVIRAPNGRVLRWIILPTDPVEYRDSQQYTAESWCPGCVCPAASTFWLVRSTARASDCPSVHSTAERLRSETERRLPRMLLRPRVPGASDGGWFLGAVSFGMGHKQTGCPQRSAEFIRRRGYRWGRTSGRWRWRQWSPPPASAQGRVAVSRHELPLVRLVGCGQWQSRFMPARISTWLATTALQ